MAKKLNKAAKAAKEFIAPRNPVIGSLTIDFHADGSESINIKGVGKLTVGRLQRAFPKIFQKFHLAMIEERKVQLAARPDKEEEGLVLENRIKKEKDDAPIREKEAA